MLGRWTACLRLLRGGRLLGFEFDDCWLNHEWAVARVAEEFRVNNDKLGFVPLGRFAGEPAWVVCANHRGHPQMYALGYGEPQRGVAWLKMDRSRMIHEWVGRAVTLAEDMRIDEGRRCLLRDTGSRLLLGRSRGGGYYELADRRILGWQGNFVWAIPLDNRDLAFDIHWRKKTRLPSYMATLGMLSRTQATAMRIRKGRELAREAAGRRSAIVEVDADPVRRPRRAAASCTACG